jgi:hypothetical protein
LITMTGPAYSRIHRSALVFFSCLLFQCHALAETDTDSALWTGGLVLWERDNSPSYSAEYQVRLDENMTALSSHFLEFMAFKKVNNALLVNGGYRYTRRPDHDEHRVYMGGFWDITRTVQGPATDSRALRLVLQVGYQHDFDVNFGDQLIGSNSIRWILVASRQSTEKLRPFLLAGLLTTWNDAYSFGVDKIRLGGGVAISATSRSRFRAQYIFEKSYFRSPEKRTNIFWLRYEANFGLE